MELERMGFDLTVMAYVLLGNTALIVTGLCLIALLKRIVKTGQEEAAFSAHQITAANAFTCSPSDIVEFIELNAYSNMKDQPDNEAKPDIMPMAKEHAPCRPFNLEAAVGF